MHKMSKQTGGKAKRVFQGAGVESVKRMIDEYLFELQITVQSLKNRAKFLKLPLQILCLYFVFHYIFLFYDTTPIWARALFMVYIWRSLGNMVSGWR